MSMTGFFLWDAVLDPRISNIIRQCPHLEIFQWNLNNTFHGHEVYFYACESKYFKRMKNQKQLYVDNLVSHFIDLMNHLIIIMINEIE